MKRENKIQVLERISDEMRAVVAYQQPDLPPWPGDSPLAVQRRYYQQERQFWNADAPPMQRILAQPVPTAYGSVNTRIYYPQPESPATLIYLHGGGFIFGNLDTHDRIMRLLAHYTRCAVIGVDYTLSPEAHYPQAIEETVAVCEFFYRHGQRFALNMSQMSFGGDSAGALLAISVALWLRDRGLRYGKITSVLLWYGLYGLQDSASRRLYGGEWDGLTRNDLAAYEQAYLRTDQDRESPWYCIFNNDLTRDVPPCFIASAEYDPLIDDSRALYHTLQAHRQPCEYRMYPGTLHAFLHYSRMMKTADDALRDGARYLLTQRDQR